MVELLRDPEFLIPVCITLVVLTLIIGATLSDIFSRSKK